METKEQEKTAVRGTCDSVDIERDFEGLCFAYRSVMARAVEAGCVTALLCAAGVALGVRMTSCVSGAVGERVGSAVEFLGGVVLCGIGLNILRVHLLA